MAGLEIHHVVADGTAAKRQCGLARLIEQRKVYPEALVGGLRAGNRLEDEVHWRTAAHQLERGRNMRQHAALRRDFKLAADIVEH